MFVGTIIGESLQNPEFVKSLKIIEQHYDQDSDWHLYKVEVTRDQIEEISKSLDEGTWYAHFWNGDDVVVAFKNITFEFSHKDQKSWLPAVNYGKSLGIPGEQLNFPID